MDKQTDQKMMTTVKKVLCDYATLFTDERFKFKSRYQVEILYGILQHLILFDMNTEFTQMFLDVQRWSPNLVNCAGFYLAQWAMTKRRAELVEYIIEHIEIPHYDDLGHTKFLEPECPMIELVVISDPKANEKTFHPGTIFKFSTQYPIADLYYYGGSHFMPYLSQNPKTRLTQDEWAYITKEKQSKWSACAKDLINYPPEYIKTTRGNELCGRLSNLNNTNPECVSKAKKLIVELLSTTNLDLYKNIYQQDNDGIKTIIGLMVIYCEPVFFAELIGIPSIKRKIIRDSAHHNYNITSMLGNEARYVIYYM
jgi:hypothetical protein